MGGGGFGMAGWRGGLYGDVYSGELFVTLTSFQGHWSFKKFLL